MSAPAKTPTRRLLAIYPTRVEAAFGAIYWRNTEGEGADIQVEVGVKGTTAERPWGVTAAKSGGGP
jgi:hypothetical protein